MPKSFNFAAPPFDSLDSAERERVRAALDIGYYRAGEVILDAHASPAHLHVLIKGVVLQQVGDETVASYGRDDYFDMRGLVAGNSSSRFVAGQEVLTYLLPKDMIQELISANAQFGAMLFSELSEKLDALAERGGRRELHSLLTARVSQAFVRQACHVDGDTPVSEVVRLMMERKISCVLVDDRARLGIFTTTDLQKAAISGQDCARLRVRDFSSFRLVTVHRQDFVFDALVAMIRKGIHRLVVLDGERIFGILEQLDLLSFLANHSHIISLQIEQAHSVADLEAVAPQVQRLIAILDGGGVKVELIARLAQELNRQIFAKVWQLVAPAALQACSCLLVMGSEGRGEQVLRTDQDNALLIADDYQGADIEDACNHFNQVLKNFGYPECPGNIMARNPLWRQSLGRFKETLRHWVHEPSAESQMNLAIFMDGAAVAGDSELLEEARAHLFSLVTDHAGFFGHFARAIDIFDEPGHWWSRVLHLGADEGVVIDLKKQGIFPIVHGVRALALEGALNQVGTVARLEALAQTQVLERGMAEELTQALHYLMGLRLKAGLQSLALGQSPDTLIRLDSLTSFERDILKDCLHQVKRFKALLHHHFHLEAF
ncbi:DUF294 nucleotidyltransferase-like domain-containing protein [Denitratisoma oestradiolicum]|uniref:Cyclic nucleotide-binding protein n=1 Tax=Denitratisoma oestradiolicum TaxID=311182 RepID=A0A6S6YRN4_9PROT|nr:DUF294 nucleotidyltransferase-like domain-containing protein [Denitratisoma oestradiolicum]TWO79613.1 hypothetical protein CBW56_13625 [Denitratisoma oestradiolicum]CAB1370412.1 Cyclic nucleotide-binding protein [Denitratisoma oestradiolicum]